jgi:hypothetical protein
VILLIETKSLLTLAVVITIVGVALGLGSLIVNEIQDTDMVSVDQTNVLGNETLTNASSMQLANSRIVASTFGLWNGTTTGTIPIPADNYTLTCSGTSACTVEILAYGHGWSNTTHFNASYSYLTVIEGSAYNITGEGLEGLDTTAGFIPVVAIVLVGAIVIGLIVSTFGGKGM